MAVPIRIELEAAITTFGARLRAAHRRLLDRRSNDLRGLARALPTADAMLALPRRRHDEAAGRLARALQSGLQFRRNRFEHLKDRLSPMVLDRQVRTERRRLTGTQDRLSPAVARLLERRRDRLNSTSRLIEVLSHHKVLARGYAVIRDDAGTVLTKANDVRAGQHLNIEMDGGTVNATADGELTAAEAGKASLESKTAARPKHRPAAKAAPIAQTDLFD